MGYLRLRQLCLVAQDLEARADEICRTFGLSIAYRDPHVAEFGLANVLIPMGRQPVFLEIVSPIAADTAAVRYLERRHGDGGYMFICDDADWDRSRRRFESMGVRVIRSGQADDDPPAQSMQLHPKDTGGTLLEFDRHGAGEDLRGGYRWAGHQWQSHIREAPVVSVQGVEIQSADPVRLAKHWARIFDRPLGTENVLEIDNAFVRFVPDQDGRGEGLSAIHLLMANGADDQIDLCGVRFHLHDGT